MKKFITSCLFIVLLTCMAVMPAKDRFCIVVGMAISAQVAAGVIRANIAA